MGVFSYPLTLIGPEGETTVDAMVDTGAVFSFVPEDVLDRLGVPRRERRRFLLADGRASEFDLGDVLARIDGREVATRCVFGDPGGPILLGAYTLEGLLLGVDPHNKRLIPVDGYLL
ncbi:MAG TPA: aspartyl protease family protein [Chloroflexota bacterium]|nr:aspartyl protease family protein [Chloroflexota bacterium]